MRGWLMPVVAARFGLAAGMIVQTVVFTLLHGASPGFSPIAFASLVTVSLLLAFWALRDENLWSVMGWHAAWNWTQGNLIGIAVSGYPSSAALLPVSVSGPAWLTGGPFGAEASLPALGVLLAGLTVVLVRRRSARS